MALNAGYDGAPRGDFGPFLRLGHTTVNLAAADHVGMEDLVIAGGTEMMSYHWPVADPSKPPMIDSGTRAPRHAPQSQQGVCADRVTLEGIDRDAVDDLALIDRARAAQAIAEGRFDKC